MGCSSSKLELCDDSIHLMLSKDSRTKAGTGIPRSMSPTPTVLLHDFSGSQFEEEHSYPAARVMVNLP
eukprot:scaffold26008_cov109-Amphora_coffeaeformis.AAC.1